MENIIVWTAIIVISLITEGLTSALVAIWFVPSALFALLLELFGVGSLLVQAIVFVVFSALFAFLLRGKIKESINKNHEKTNIDAIVGKTALVISDIPAGELGRVKLGDVSWSAYTNESRTVTSGEKVTVLEVSGVKLLCEPLCENNLDPSLIGKKARVVLAIDGFSGSGSVIADGKSYPAKAQSDFVIATGEIVEITGIDGGKLVCEVSVAKE